MSGPLFSEYCSILELGGLRLSDLERISELRPCDAVIVVDMQHDFLPGGSFGVPEGNDVLSLICELMKRAAEASAAVYCTRDYHPLHHCSFSSQKGPFPPHCVQGTVGSHLVPCIAELVQRFSTSCRVVFKGFSPDVDSFGSFPYKEGSTEGRVSRNASGAHCGLNWTGAASLFSSNFANDANAPPDVMSILNPVSLADSLLDHLLRNKSGITTVVNEEEKSKRKPLLLICGLTLDFCVLDTAVNASRCTEIREAFEVVVVLNASRAAHSSVGGKFGSGFLSDPHLVLRTLHNNDIKLMLL